MPLTRSRTLECLAREELAESTPTEDAAGSMPDIVRRPEAEEGAPKRKRTRPFLQSNGVTATPPATIGASTPSTVKAAGMLGTLPDDAVLLIMHNTVRLPRFFGRNSLEMRAGVLEGARSLRALQLTCRHVRLVLEGVGSLLREEMAARAATHIAPPPDAACEGPFPFTVQLHREQRSSRQLAAFQDAISAMAVHCAGPCCSKAHAEFARGHSSRRITPAARRSTLLTAPPSGNCAFIASRHRQEGYRLRGRGSRSPVPDGRMTSEWILQVASERCKETNAVQLTDLGQFSPAHSMRASPCGTATTLIRSVYASHVDDTMPHSVVMVWNVGRAVDQLGDVLEPPSEAEDLGAINAQDAWWVGNDATRLAVLWSTGYVHPVRCVNPSNALPFPRMRLC